MRCVTDLTSEDRRLFTALCQFVWVQGEPLPLIFSVEHDVYTRQGITLPVLRRLAQLDLITLEPSGFVKKGFGKHTRLFYCGKPTKIGFQKALDNQLDLGHVMLTEYGKAYFTQITVTRNQQFYEYVIKRWFQEGLLLSSIQINKNWKTTPSHSACFLTEQE